jgi:hypothetical protein
MKVNNFLVTGADLATMGYRQKPGTTPPLDGSIMSKGEADANYYIDGSVSPWSTYPNTRAPKYQDYPCPCVASFGVDNTLAFGYSQTISYEDCSGNTLYVYAPYGQITVVTACTFISGDSGPIAGCGILRGSVVGANLAAVDYGGCCYSNYPCTTSTTTTLPQCNYNGLTVVCNTPVGYATLEWSFLLGSGSVGSMELYVNGSVIESRSFSSNGTWNVGVGDQIYAEVFSSGCDSFATKANAYTFGIIADAACGDGSVILTTGTYTVTAGDIGNTLIFQTFSACENACL